MPALICNATSRIEVKPDPLLAEDQIVACSSRANFPDAILRFTEFDFIFYNSELLHHADAAQNKAL